MPILIINYAICGNHLFSVLYVAALKLFSIREMIQPSLLLRLKLEVDFSPKVL